MTSIGGSGEELATTKADPYEMTNKRTGNINCKCNCGAFLVGIFESTNQPVYSN
jgi:hypothetical protein